MVLPFKWNFFCWIFAWYFSFLRILKTDFGIFFGELFFWPLWRDSHIFRSALVKDRPWCPDITRNKLKPVSAVPTVQAKMNCNNLSLYMNQYEKVRLHDWERFYLLSALSLPEFIKHLTNECAVVVLSATVAFCKHSCAKCNNAFTDFSKKGFQWEITAQSACISAAFSFNLRSNCKTFPTGDYISW